MSRSPLITVSVIFFFCTLSLQQENPRRNEESNFNTPVPSINFRTLQKPELQRPGTVTVSNGRGGTMNIPIGVYHNYVLSTNVDTDFGLPTSNIPLHLNGAATTEREILNGLYLPMPLGMTPINIQLKQKLRKGGKLGGDVAKGTEARLLQRYNKIKELCMIETTKNCEKALKDYYTTRVQQFQEDNSSLHQQLLQIGTEAASEIIANKQDFLLSSMLLDLPGMQEPVYVSATSNNDDNNNIKLSFD